LKERALRIAVADDEPVMQLYLEETLTDFGHEVTGVAKDGLELVEFWEKRPADLIITDIKMPTMDGVSAVREIYRRKTVPVVLLTGYNSLESIGAENEDFVMVYLVKPIGAEELQKAIGTAMQRFAEFDMLVKECGDLSTAHKHRRLIERAKELLATCHGIDEPQAFEKLRSMVGEGHSSLSEAAASVVRSMRCA
jgi:AmiR/NasT family two-component response regulator